MTDPRRAFLAMMAGPALLLGLGVAACGEKEPPVDPELAEKALKETQDTQAFPSLNSPEVLQDPMNNVVRAVYACDNNERLTVDFDNPRDMATARTSKGLAADLHQQTAASGYWYKAGGFELRGKGGDITWTTPDTLPTNCRIIR